MNIKSALRTLKRMLFLAKAFDHALTASLFFLVVALVLTTLQQPWVYAAIPAGVYFIFRLGTSARSIRYRDVEEKIPELEWQLRTVADNLHRDNEIIRRLHASVLEKMQRVRELSFFRAKQTLYKILGIASLGALLTLMFQFPVTLEQLLPTTGFAIGGSSSEPKETSAEELGKIDSHARDEDIYGEKSIYELGNDELSLEFQHQGGAFDPATGLQNPESRDVIENEQTPFGRASPDSSFEERIKKEDQEIVKRYFDQLQEEDEQ